MGMGANTPPADQTAASASASATPASAGSKLTPQQFAAMQMLLGQLQQGSQQAQNNALRAVPSAQGSAMPQIQSVQAGQQVNPNR